MRRHEAITLLSSIMRISSASQFYSDYLTRRFSRVMAFYFASWWVELYFTLFLLLFGVYAYYKLFTSRHWKKRNIPHVDPVFLLGNLWRVSVTETFPSVLQEIYRRHKKDKVVGLWGFLSPMLMVTDINIIKNILVRDFSHFRDHGFEFDTEGDPLSAHLFNLKGAKWRNLRVKLTPTFTSGKMKMMFPTIMECGQELQQYLKTVAAENREVEVKDILARFTTDVIGTCAFGIQTNSLKNPNSEFRRYGKKVFEPTPRQIINNIIITVYPKLFKMLKIKLLAQDVSDFFLKAVKETMDYRETNQVRRNDFMDLLMQLKSKGKLEDVDEVVPALDDKETTETDMSFTLNDAAAQAFVFFFAGFETSSTTLSYALYELALNTDVQETLQHEIDKHLSKTDGKPTYEAIMAMEYLDWVVQETLRKHPLVGVLNRECTKDYEIPEMNITIEKNCPVLIPVFAIHRDPEIYPNPDRFDPTRFSPEMKSTRDNFVYLPFGEGPRICIGNRFALLQTKIGLVSILSKYNVLVSTRTPTPMAYDPYYIILTPKGGMHLKFSVRH